MECDTKYPLLLVHGIGFHDHENRKHSFYWGRIPVALEKQGAQIFYGYQDSWATIEYNADIVKESLLKVLAETGYEKVNIIAHSKGGLEARYLISTLGMADKVASLTTLCTPHHGSKTIDQLCRLPRWTFRFIAVFVNIGSRIMGDSKPDFYRASRRFSTESMKKFNEQNPDAPSVFYRSFAALMKSPLSDIFLSIPYLVVKRTEGENDGLVTAESAAWANYQGALSRTTRRGISHSDVVDPFRKNFSIKLTNVGSEANTTVEASTKCEEIANSEAITYKDIKEFYIAMISDLKSRGF